MSNDIDELFDDFENNNLNVFCLLSDGNPGAFVILANLFKNINTSTLVNFLKNIFTKNIIGSRLWYIYKNECNQDIHQLLTKDLTQFDNVYFYEKFEKYI